MGTSERADRPTWQVLVALAGAATAIVLVIYLVGGAIVWERLHVLRLPANPAVSPLPRNLLLIDGVRALAWPVALALIAAGLVSLLTHMFRFEWRAIGATCSVLFVVWVAALVAILSYDTGPEWQHLVFLTTLGTLVAVAIAVVHWQLVAVRRVAVCAALAMFVTGVVVEAIDIGSLPVRMEYAHVSFVKSRPPMEGFYIGATSDAVYLAPNLRCHVLGRIVALPQRDVAQVDVFTSKEAWPDPRHTDHHCPHWSDPARTVKYPEPPKHDKAHS
jgi:hypothetical protein